MDKLGQTVTENTKDLENSIQSLDTKIGQQPTREQSLNDFRAALRQEIAPILSNTPAVTSQGNNKIFWLNTKVELVKDHTGNSHVGGRNSWISFKDHNSYFIATDQKGYILYENGKKVSEGLLHSRLHSGTRSVYVKETNCYFLLGNNKLYKKAINGHSPELWINDHFGTSSHAPMLYSKNLKRIVTVKSTKTIAFIDPTKKAIEFQLNLPIQHGIMNYRFFGEGDQYVLFITHNRFIGLVKYDVTAKTGKLITIQQYAASRFKTDWAAGIDIDTNNKVIMVSHYYWDPPRDSKFSRVVVFELWNDRLTQKASLDVMDGTQWLQAFRFVGYYQDEATFLGIDTQNGGAAHIFRYNVNTKVITRDSQKSVPHLEDYIWRMSKLDDWFYYTGKKGRVMRVKVYDSSV